MPEYSHEEAEEILRRALAREPKDGVSHDDLVAAASEVGIDAAEVERAAQELAEERTRAEREHDVRAALRRRFATRVANALGLNAFLLAIDVMTGPGFWVQWVALATAVHLLSQTVRTFAPSEETLRKTEKRLEKRARRRERRETRRDRRWARSDRERRRNTEAQFERVVEEGVEALLRSAGDRLERYNREQQQPRVRVAVPSEGESAGETEESVEDDAMGDEGQVRSPRDPRR